MLRELTQEYATLLKELATRTVLDPAAGGGSSSAAAAAGGAAAAASGGGGGGALAAGAAAAGGGGGKTLLEWLLENDPATGFGAVTTAVAGMCWRDEAAYRFAMLARTLVGMAPRDQRLYAYVGGEVLKSAISSLATEVSLPGGEAAQGSQADPQAGRQVGEWGRLADCCWWGEPGLPCLQLLRAPELQIIAPLLRLPVPADNGHPPGRHHAASARYPGAASQRPQASTQPHRLAAALALDWQCCIACGLRLVLILLACLSSGRQC
jgi:hypothetical protein